MLQDTDTWAIIYCRKQGSLRAASRWREIQQYMHEEGITFVTQESNTQLPAASIAAQYVAQGYQTLIVVGGDADLNQVINGMLSVQHTYNAALPAVGVIPHGLFNDFARFWGIYEDHYKQHIQALRRRQLRKIDVGVCTLNLRHQQAVQQYYFLNCVNIGLAALIANLTTKSRRFWGLRTLIFLYSAVILLFQRLDYKMRFKINWETIEKRFMTVCVGSALGYGQTPSAVPYNGLLDVSAVTCPQTLQIFQGLWRLVTGRFLSQRQVFAWRSKCIVFEKLGKAKVSIDGNMVKGDVGNMMITILPEHLSFIIP